MNLPLISLAAIRRPLASRFGGILRFSFVAALGLAALPQAAPAAIVLDLTGTPDAPVLTATVDNADVFTTGPFDNLTFFLPPNSSGVDFEENGPLGSINDDIFRGPASGAYINLLRLSSGDGSTFTLDATHPYTSSSTVIRGLATSLAAFDGVSSLMSVNTGTGPSTLVEFHDELAAVPEPSSVVLLGLGAIGLLFVARRRRRLAVAG